MLARTRWREHTRRSDAPPGGSRSLPLRLRTSRHSDPSGVKILGAPDLQ